MWLAISLCEPSSLKNMARDWGAYFIRNILVQSHTDVVVFWTLWPNFEQQKKGFRENMCLRSTQLELRHTATSQVCIIPFLVMMMTLTLLQHARFMCHNVIDFGQTDFSSNLWNTRDLADLSTKVPKSFNSVQSLFTGNPEKRITVSKRGGAETGNVNSGWTH